MTADALGATVDVLDPQARLSEMFDLHYASIWRVVQRLGVSAGDADDAAQRTFLVASRRLDVIEVGREGAYLYGVAVRVASEMRRRGSRETHDEEAVARLADDAPGPEDALIDAEARAALDAVLASMPEDLRVAMVLVDIEGVSVPELASALSIPLGTASSRIRRARESFTEAARRHRARMNGGGR